MMGRDGICAVRLYPILLIRIPPPLSRENQSIFLVPMPSQAFCSVRYGVWGGKWQKGKRDGLGKRVGKREVDVETEEREDAQ